ncbi:hypothetical protein Tco_0508752 [Tanacetum coccineum]
MVGGNCGNQFRQFAGQNIRNQNGVLQIRIHIECNRQYAALAEGVMQNCNNVIRIRFTTQREDGSSCYELHCPGPRRRMPALTHTQMLIAQKKKSRESNSKA